MKNPSKACNINHVIDGVVEMAENVVHNGIGYYREVGRNHFPRDALRRSLSVVGIASKERGGGMLVVAKLQRQDDGWAVMLL